MRAVILGLIALVGVVAMSDSASARDRQYRRVRYSQEQVQYSQPQGQQNYYYQQEDRQGMFGGLMDMERRKNAWLRQTFFGQ